MILSHGPRYVDHEFSGHIGCLLEVVVALGGLSAYGQGRTTEQSKEKAWEHTEVSLAAGRRHGEARRSGAGDFEGYEGGEASD